MTTVAQRLRLMARDEVTRSDARGTYPDQAALEAMPAEALAEHIADCARSHGGQCFFDDAASTEIDSHRLRDALPIRPLRKGAA